MTIVWNEENAAHLFKRAGFGATAQSITAAVKLGQEKTVDKILTVPKTSDKLPATVKELDGLQGWWVNRMVKSKFPITERLTLFWHNHFATGFSKVGRVDYMHRQNAIFRAYGMAKFRDLVTEVSKDPAMLIWLDNKTNVKGKQNQNFARELMELFTTGVLDKDGFPNYSETDVDESAKAFTGWQIKNDAFFFNDPKHDHTVKNFKGLTGDLDGVDIINLLVLDPATVRRIPQLLFSYFAYPIELTDPMLDGLAQTYLQNDTAMAPVLRQIFLSDEFYSDAAKTSNIKEPAVFFVCALRAVKARMRLRIYDKGQKAVVSNATSLSDRLDRLGQALFDPPTVFGWKPGLAWATAAGMLERAKAGEWICDARSTTHLIAYSAQRILGPGFFKLSPAEAATRIMNNLGVRNPDLLTLTAMTNYLLANDDGAAGEFVLDKTTIDKKVRGAIALVLGSAEYQRDSTSRPNRGRDRIQSAHTFGEHNRGS